MTDADALLRAICATPDADLPRLAFADYLDENGDPERAAFIRAQVEVARLPDWEPFAVWCRLRKPEWTHGRPWISLLPALPSGWSVEWDEIPFRRGFGWRVKVHSLLAWEQIAARLFESNPIGDLLLHPATTLDGWREFARAEWIRHLRILRLDGANLSEPLFALRERRVPPTLEEVHFLRASSPGMGFILSDLLSSPMAESIRALHLRLGMGSLDDVLDALTIRGNKLERLSLVHLGIDSWFLQEFGTRSGLRNLTALNLANNPIHTDGVTALATGLRNRAFHSQGDEKPFTTLGLAGIHLESAGMETLVDCPALTSLRRLDLSRNPLRPRATKLLAESKPLAGLRSLNLSECRIGDKGMRHLTQAKFWPNLVELDLRENPITGLGAKYLLDAAVPKELTALLLDGSSLGVGTREELRRKFHDAVLFVPSKWAESN